MGGVRRKGGVKILGIDPGLNVTGYGIIEDSSTSLGSISLAMPRMRSTTLSIRPEFTEGRAMPSLPRHGMVSTLNHKRPLKLVEAGVIKTQPKTPIKNRLKKIFDTVTEIIEEHKPGVLVLEKIYSHYKHPTTAILMGHARAAVCLACGMHNVELINYPSTRIKKAVTGNGHASKYQIQRMVQDLLNLKKPPEPVDVSDALAMAISYCFIEKRIGPR